MGGWAGVWAGGRTVGWTGRRTGSQLEVTALADRPGAHRQASSTSSNTILPTVTPPSSAPPPRAMGVMSPVTTRSRSAPGRDSPCTKLPKGCTLWRLTVGKAAGAGKGEWDREQEGDVQAAGRIRGTPRTGLLRLLAKHHPCC